MKSTRYQFRGHQCFGSKWIDLPAPKTFNVVVGRNNSGKSRLLDVVNEFTCDPLRADSIEKKFVITAERLDVAFFGEGAIRQPDPDTEVECSSGGGLELRYAYRQPDVIREGFCRVGVQNDSHDNSDLISVAELYEFVDTELPSFEGLFVHGVSWCRLRAERDIQPETPTQNITLEENGQGATSLIHRFITHSKYDNSVIQRDVLNGLCEIFGPDGDFTGIMTRQLGDLSVEPPSNLWEIFLTERRKPGVIAVSQSGSGLKTVLLVLLNLIVRPVLESQDPSNYVYAFEELENNLHPAILRRLYGFLVRHAEEHGCVFYLTSHSSVTLDYFSANDNAQIIQVLHNGESSSIQLVEAHFDRVEVLSNLGSKPSDLLQANGVIWVEGPSDRIYVNRFVELYSNGELREGREFQCAYYGGSVLANVEYKSPEEANLDFANLLRLNANIAVLCDSDRVTDGSEVKGRVARISSELRQIPNAYLWVTEPKEIENYIPGSVWSQVYSRKDVPDPGKYDSFPGSPNDGDYVKDHLERKTFDKVEFAKLAVPHLTRQVLDERFDFKSQIVELVERIRKWNS